MDSITLQRITQAHPKIREQLLQDYKDANNLLGKGCRLRFSYVYRSAKEQHEIFLKRPKVTNADAWQSIHNYGLAFDIVLLYDKDGNGNFEAVSWDMKYDGDKDGMSDWLEITKLFTLRGYTNGFISNGKKWDFPHFQKDFGYNWRKLKNLIDNGDIISDSNGINYPKI
jgi:peptidoglycan L-alanyl-D-glutamate endopeptidase CwlK